MLQIWTAHWMIYFQSQVDPNKVTGLNYDWGFKLVVLFNTKIYALKHRKLWFFFFNCVPCNLLSEAVIKKHGLSGWKIISFLEIATFLCHFAMWCLLAVILHINFNYPGSAWIRIIEIDVCSCFFVLCFFFCAIFVCCWGYLEFVLISYLNCSCFVSASFFIVILHVSVFT